MNPDALLERLARALASRYDVTRELGRGGMGSVFLATDRTLGRELAIKVLPPETREYLGGERFERELRIAAKLAHPHIVPVFDAGEADGLLYYAMAYVPGETLAERVRRDGPLPLDEALRFTAEIADALHYAHEQGVIHRDIKPSNIMLSRGHALVLDFGIAKAVAGDGAGDAHSLTATGVVVGTVEYMSPEQAAGEKRLDARTDVYALAGVTYEMLAGEPPFSGPSAQAILARVIADAPRLVRTVRPEVPPHVERALRAGLAKLPVDRPATAREFVALLGHATPEPAGPARGRRMTLAAAVILGTGLAGWLLIPQLRDVTPPRAARPPAGMVLVPAGEFSVGGAADRPAQRVRLDSFYVDSTEVTIGAYARLLAARGGPVPWRAVTDSHWPVTGVLWTEASAYCAWRDSLGRLPTEDEWEAAARGPEGRRYPWGDAWERVRANADSLLPALAPVGAFPLGRSWVGALDLAGNAWEWTATAAPPAHGPNESLRHVIKGGAFDSPHRAAAAAHRSALPDDRAAIANTGFRCARPVPARGGA